MFIINSYLFIFRFSVVRFSLFVVRLCLLFVVRYSSFDIRLFYLSLFAFRFIYLFDERRTNSERRFNVYGRKTNFEGRYFIDEINLFNIIVILSDLLEIIS
jgi:hypothetical protein